MGGDIEINEDGTVVQKGKDFYDRLYEGGTRIVIFADDHSSEKTYEYYSQFSLAYKNEGLAFLTELVPRDNFIQEYRDFNADIEQLENKKAELDNNLPVNKVAKKFEEKGEYHEVVEELFEKKNSVTYHYAQTLKNLNYEDIILYDASQYRAKQDNPADFDVQREMLHPHATKYISENLKLNQNAFGHIGITHLMDGLMPQENVDVMTSIPDFQESLREEFIGENEVVSIVVLGNDIATIDANARFSIINPDNPSDNQNSQNEQNFPPLLNLDKNEFLKNAVSGRYTTLPEFLIITNDEFGEEEIIHLPTFIAYAKENNISFEAKPKSQEDLNLEELENLTLYFDNINNEGEDVFRIIENATDFYRYNLEIDYVDPSPAFREEYKEHFQTELIKSLEQVQRVEMGTEGLSEEMLKKIQEGKYEEVIQEVKTNIENYKEGQGYIEHGSNLNYQPYVESLEIEPNSVKEIVKTLASIDDTDQLKNSDLSKNNLQEKLTKKSSPAIIS